jgi:hypothetical protein
MEKGGAEDVCLFVCLSVRLSVCLSVCLSVWPEADRQLQLLKQKLEERSGEKVV